MNGSPFSVSITYATNAYASTTTTLNAGQLTVYTLPATYAYTVGSYSATGAFGPGGVQIRDNYDIGSNLVKDAIAFVDIGRPTNDSPFDFGTLPVYTELQVDAYDLNRLTLNGTDLGQIAEFGAFPRTFAEFAFTNSVFTTSVIAQGDITSVSFGEAAAAVPEPDSWALALMGLGVTGTMLRAKRKRVNRSVASGASPLTR